ncbi:MAG: hypothetical protein ABI877_23285, partial [Gemmatimonadaceae bacterium]
HYLRARVVSYDPSSLGSLAASGSVVWAAEAAGERAEGGAADGASGAPRFASAPIGRLRFFERGTGRLWLRPPVPDDQLSDVAQAVLQALRSHGASFTSDLAAATASGPQRLRDALRELVAAGLITNDTIESLREVLRWRPVFPVKRGEEPDPTRWLPADFTPSAGRPVVQRRINPRRLARWQRPDRPGAQQWGGRWSLLHIPGTLGTSNDEPTELAEGIARQWLLRYGVVSRDWWRRERPAIGWREIYLVLKRLEFRGEVRRGYFVAGLAGAQFALPEAVEALRAPMTRTGQSEDAPATPVAMATSDPANVYALPLSGDVEADPLARPRGAGSVIVTSEGRIVLTSEGRGRRLRVREGADAALVRQAVAVLLEHLTARGPLRRSSSFIETDTINGEPASSSAYANSLQEAGFRSSGGSMRFYMKVP